MTTKKDLLHLLQSIYEGIPDCTCYKGYTVNGRFDPSCHRHAVYTEEEINYIRIVLGNTAVTNP